MYTEIMDRFFYFTAKLDGVSSQAIKRMADAHHSSINEWLEIDSADTKDTGKKRVCLNRIIIVFFYVMTKKIFCPFSVKFFEIKLYFRCVGQI